MNKNIPALLLGIDNLIGFQISRILRKLNVPVIGTAEDLNSHHCRTRSIVRIVPVSYLTKEPGKLLNEIFTEYGKRPVVIPCRDEDVWWLSENQELVKKYADVLLPPSKVHMLLSDKIQFYSYAIEHKLPIPDTHFINTSDELEQVIKELTFPIVLKPPRHTIKWIEATKGFKVFKVENAETLRHLVNTYLHVAGKLIVQTWVEGPDSNMHSFYSCLDRQSKPLTTCIIAKKIRQWPPDIGEGSLAMEVRIDEVAKIGLELLQKVGYAGPSSVQFKQDAVTKKFYIIEINTRPALNFQLFESCGVEMIHTYYCAIAGLPLPENRTITRPGSKWISWHKDLASAYAHWRRGDLSIREWITSLRGHKWTADIYLDDLMPFLIFIGRKIIGKGKKGLHLEHKRSR
jgi:predicted ATP-grasp superfamily ATP-dependent carboligase